MIDTPTGTINVDRALAGVSVAVTGQPEYWNGEKNPLRPDSSHS